ncbi:MAG: PEP-CTERM sorting domain-containing protein [Isosphaeraceae bacterium]
MSFLQLAKKVSVLALVLAAPAACLADIAVTAEAPGVQSSQVAGVTTMNFDFPAYAIGSYTNLTSPIGTYTAASPGLKINGPDTFGGANQTQYMAVGSQSAPTTVVNLALSGPMAYFGLYWGAVDAQNELQFKSGSTVIAKFDAASVLNFLDTLPSGTKSQYFGNPNTNPKVNTSEPYLYLNFFGTNGTTFDSIVFVNKNTGTGFESDNHSVRVSPVTPTGTPVGVIPVPEPSSVLLAGIGLVMAAGQAWRSRRNREVAA